MAEFSYGDDVQHPADRHGQGHRAGDQASNQHPSARWNAVVNGRRCGEVEDCAAGAHEQEVAGEVG